MPSETSLSSIRADAIARRDRGDLNGARGLLERALEAAALTSGDDHPEVLTTAHLLAALHRQSGDLSGARRVLEGALYAGSNRHGDDHPLLLAISFDLGEIADELGNRHEARKHYTRVARFGPASPGFNQQQVQAARAWLGPSAPAAAANQGRPVTVPAPEPLGVQATPPAQAEPAPPRVPAEWPPTPFTPVNPAAPAQPPPPAPPAAPAPPAHPAPQVQPPPPALPTITGARAATPAPPGYTPGHPAPAPPHWNQAQGVTAASTAGSHRYPPQTTMPPTATPPPQLPGPGYGPSPPRMPQPQPPQRRGRGALIGSLVAAAVAVIAAGVTVFVLLNQGSGGPPQPPVDGAAGAATDLVISMRDERVTLNWTDPSHGEAQPIIVGARESEGWRRFAVPAKGATSSLLPGLNKKYDYCFRVLLAYSVDDVKQSQEVCTDRTKTSPSPSS